MTESGSAPSGRLLLARLSSGRLVGLSPEFEGRLVRPGPLLSLPELPAPALGVARHRQRALLVVAFDEHEEPRGSLGQVLMANAGDESLGLAVAETLGLQEVEGDDSGLRWQGEEVLLWQPDAAYQRLKRGVWEQNALRRGRLSSRPPSPSAPPPAPSAAEEMGEPKT